MESSVYNVNVKDPTDFIRLTDDSKKRRITHHTLK